MLKPLAIVCALALAPLAASAAQLPDYPFIHASGSAALYVAPDIGEIDFEINAYDADPEVARVLVEARVAEILAMLEQQGVPPADVETRDVRKELRKGNPDPNAPVAYDIKCTMHITVRQLTKWRAVVQPLLGMKNVDSFASSFGATEHDKIEGELTIEAIKDARRKAEAMAAGLGRKLGAATAVSSGALKNLGNAMGLVQAQFYGRQSSDEQTKRSDFLSVDVIKMAQPVDVIFRIK
jgi:uncharacterized protein YggE